MVDDDFEKFKRKMMFEQVSKVFKENPKNWADQLEDLGFTWFDDEFDQEEIEENSAKPENLNQELLVAYFEDSVKYSKDILNSYLSEKESSKPNYPLIRKYYKSGNENLKRLIISGLKINPADIGLLSDLAYYHEYKNILSKLIFHYLNACEEEQDIKKFEQIVLNFYYDTEADGFEALHELQKKYGIDSEKDKIVQKIIQEQKSAPESIEF